MSAVRHYRNCPWTADPTGQRGRYETHHDPRSGLHQRVYRCEPGRTRYPAPGAGRLETLFVLAGSGRLVLAGAEHRLAPSVAALVLGERPYEMVADSALTVVSVSADQPSGRAPGAYRPTVDLAAQLRQDAVSDREFQVLFDPDRGCLGVTQFVGYIPRLRTPRHFHPYSEMITVLAGRGQVEIEGTRHPLEPGSCFYLPAGVHHLVENVEDGFLQLLGVFTPAGSPAENTPADSAGR